jgi:uncharacterized protein YggL (DUF469 family)
MKGRLQEKQELLRQQEGRQAGGSQERRQKRRRERKKLHEPELETLMVVSCTWQAKQKSKEDKRASVEMIRV